MRNGTHADEAEGVPDDLGDPIAELRDFEEDASHGFLGRVLSALHRRSLVGQMATLAWTASAQAFFEFLGMIFSLFTPGDLGPNDPEKEDRNSG